MALFVIDVHEIKWFKRERHFSLGQLELIFCFLTKILRFKCCGLKNFTENILLLLKIHGSY